MLKFCSFIQKATTSQDGKNISNDIEVNEQNIECDIDENGGLRIDEEIYIPPPVKDFCEVDSTGPRLIITQIINENFKSYFGTHMIGPFHKVSLSVRCAYCLLKDSIQSNFFSEFFCNNRTQW